MAFDMTAGVVGIVDGSSRVMNSEFNSDPPGEINREKIVVQGQGGNSVQSSLTALNQNSGPDYQTGTIYVNESVETESMNLTEDGEIESENQTIERTTGVEFSYIPNKIFVVDKKEHTFIFDLMNRLIGANVYQAEINVRDYTDRLDDPEITSETISDRPGNVRNATGSGNVVDRDPQFSQMKSQSPRSSQAYLKTRQSEPGNINLQLTSSGVVRIYSGLGTTGEFLSFILEEIGMHINNDNFTP
jgi:hypothetical protein